MERANFFARNPHVSKFAKSGIDSVNDRIARNDVVDDFTRFQNALARRSRDLHQFASVGDSNNLLKRERLTA